MHEQLTPTFLFQATVDILPDAKCRAKYSPLVQWVLILPVFNYYWGPNQICVGDSRQAACHGDSGGPLAVEVEAGVYEVWGAASYGDGSCNPRDKPYMTCRLGGRGRISPK